MADIFGQPVNGRDNTTAAVKLILFQIETFTFSSWLEEDSSFIAVIVYFILLNKGRLTYQPNQR